MTKLNYPEMLQSIKMYIFTGDHSAVYSLACAIACIAAMVSLLWWYNKMLNDPYGRLDMRSIIRTAIVLFLTCNFYSFVLVPFDSITHYVAKAITASVDKDAAGLSGRILDALGETERKNQEESLGGQFEEEMSRSSSITSDDSGLSGETSFVLESLAESAIEGGRKQNIFQKAWNVVKTAVSVKVGSVVSGVATVLSWLRLREQYLHLGSAIYPDFFLDSDVGHRGLCELPCERCAGCGVLAGGARSPDGFPAAYDYH